MQPRMIQVLCLLLVVVPLWARAAPLETEERLSMLEPVGVSEYQGGLKLGFKKLGPNPALELFSLEDARAVVAALGPRPPTHALMTVTMAGMLVEQRQPALPDLEKSLRETYEALYGPGRVALPESLRSARWFQALELSPRYMGEGVREAAVEMFSSPAVLVSVGMSMMLYMGAWAAPEPALKHLYSLEWG